MNIATGSLELKANYSYNPFVKQKSVPDIPVSEIYKALSRTTAGISLKKNARYEPFRHKTEDHKHWRSVLGPSAITYSHMKHVYKLTKRALDHETQMNPKSHTSLEREMLLLASLCHDFGEAVLDQTSVGDVPAPLKKPDHEKKEREVFKKVLKSLELESKLKQKLLKSYLEVCHNKNSHLFKYFHLIEHIDYLDTGLHIYRSLTRLNKTLKRGKYVIGQILTFSIPILVDEKRNHHPSTRRFIYTKRHEITAMFKFCANEYRKAESQKKVIPGIDVAFMRWQQYSKA